MKLFFLRTLKWLGWTLFGICILAGGAWFYWGYSPVPEEPELGVMASLASLMWDDREREYIEYIPAGLPDNAPLVIVLHGSAMNADQMRIVTGYEFDQLADSKKFAVVYPMGYFLHWNDCRNKATFAAKRENIDDVGFLQALIKRMIELHRVDPSRIFLVGYSNGGHMSFKFDVMVPRRVAGIAVVAASLSVAEDSSCYTQAPSAPIMLVNGTADLLNPYLGGQVSILGMSKRGRVMPAPEMAFNFARRNGIEAEPITEVMPDLDKNDGTQVTRLSWYLNDKPHVVFYSVAGGGHVVPQQFYRLPRMYGPTSKSMDFPLSAVQFFGL